MSSFNKKYQIFISSTYTDLKEERDEVTKAILTHYHIPIGMEMFSADDAEQWETIQDTIDSSDYYVLIIGHRYGSVDPEEGISYTEKEFNYARSKGIPSLVFVRDRDQATTPAQRDSDPEYALKLNAFIESATKKRLVSFWKNKDELAAQVMASLQKASRKNDIVGWVRADSIPNANEVLAELALLQKENRELRTELEGIRVKRMPNFVLLFNDDTKVTIKNDFNHTVKNSFIKTNNIYFERKYFANLEQYARNVRIHKDKAERYNSLLLKHMVENDYKKINLIIKNVGNASGTDINLTISFPERSNILLESKANAPEFKPEKNMAEFSLLKQLIPDPNPKLFAVNSLNLQFPNFVKRTSYDIDLVNNTLRIKIPKILHFNQVEIKNIFISGQQESFEEYIRVEMIYEEVLEPNKFEIPITYEYIHNQNLINIE
jgi:hypothetical protein